MKYSYLLTTFRCLSDILITSCWLFKLQLDQAQTSRKTGLRIKEQKKEVDSFTGGTQTRASRARESSVTHKSAITDHAVEENHVIDWDEAKVVDREAQRQTRWIKEALWTRKTPMSDISWQLSNNTFPILIWCAVPISLCVWYPNLVTVQRLLMCSLHSKAARYSLSRCLSI